MPKRFLITTALPYANGPIHIGHLAGVYVPADIYARYLRKQGKDVLMIGGSDEHGVPITLKAKKECITPQQVVDRYHNIIKKSFETFGISFDVYSRTSSRTHHETASEFFKKLYEEGKFIEQITEQYYDTEANEFLADRYIKGQCPKCGTLDAYGDQCEKCGSTLSPSELINPKSTLSGSTPILKPTKHWYLPLNQYEPWLKEWILEGHKEWKANVYGQCKSWIDGGLQARAVTRDLDWGVKVPVSGTEGKVLYVWFDAPIGYISATKELTKDWELYWKDKYTKMVHFIGKDNIVFHCIIFPVMLKAEGTYNLPENVPANEFLNLEGDKISTSRNWAVWLHKYLQDFPNKQDVLRYVLTANAPETKDNDFTWKDFQTRNNSELVAVLGNFVNRTLVLTDKYFNGIVPKAQLTGQDKQILAEISTIKANVEKELENYCFRAALKEAMTLARLGNKYLTDTEPWKIIKTDEERVKSILYVCLQITANIGIMFEPFLPFTSKKICDILNMDSNQAWDNIGLELLKSGQSINKAELLFEKIEDAQIDEQLKKLEVSKALNMNSTEAKPLKAPCSYDDFQKMDIRTATVLKAEKVAKTKKLLKLDIDTGVDKRTIVSGIAEYYEPETLIGKQIVILANLEPREIKGIVSNGMILMVEDVDGSLKTLVPSQKVSNGAIIS